MTARAILDPTLLDPAAFLGIGFLVLATTLGCSGPPGARAPASRAVPGPAARHVGHAPALLEKAFTGQARPSLLVKNGFPRTQHVFVDWVERAVLVPEASERLEVGIGTHTVTCADSADPDDNPAAVTESFDTGYAYSYEIRPSS